MRDDLADMWSEGFGGKMMVALLGSSALLIAGMVAMVPPMVYEGIASSRLERRCLAVGYPSADWRWFGPDYCVKRLDQTDVVVPVAEAERHPGGPDAD